MVVAVVATEIKDRAEQDRADRAEQVAAAKETVALHWPIPVAVAVAVYTVDKHRAAVVQMVL